MKKSVILRLSEVNKRFPASPTLAVDNISFSLTEGEILSDYLPSGCGKTAPLRMIAGFEKPSQGVIELGGRIVADEKTFIPGKTQYGHGFSGLRSFSPFNYR